MLTVILAGMVLNGTLDVQEAEWICSKLANIPVPPTVSETVTLLKQGRVEYAKWKSSTASTKRSKVSRKRTGVANSSKRSTNSATRRASARAATDGERGGTSFANVTEERN